MQNVPLEEDAIGVQDRVAAVETAPVGKWRMMLMTAKGPITLKEANRTLRDYFVDAGSEIKLEVRDCVSNRGRDGEPRAPALHRSCCSC